MAASSSIAIGNVVEDHLSCPICTNVVPLRLPPCQHRICETCINKMKNRSDKSPAVFKCPMCEAESSGHFPLCILTESIRDSLTSRGNKTYTGEGFMLCEEQLCGRQVDRRCRKCRRFICFRCSKANQCGNKEDQRHCCDDVDDLCAAAKNRLEVWQQKIRTQVTQLQSILKYTEQLYRESDSNMVNVILFAEQLDESETGGSGILSSVQKSTGDDSVSDKLVKSKDLSSGAINLIKAPNVGEINNVIKPAPVLKVGSASEVRQETNGIENTTVISTLSTPILKMEGNKAGPQAQLMVVTPKNLETKETKPEPTPEEIEETKRQFQAAIAAKLSAPAATAEPSPTDKVTVNGVAENKSVTKPATDVAKAADTTKPVEKTSPPVVIESKTESVSQSPADSTTTTQSAAAAVPSAVAVEKEAVKEENTTPTPLQKQETKPTEVSVSVETPADEPSQTPTTTTSEPTVCKAENTQQPKAENTQPSKQADTDSKAEAMPPVDKTDGAAISKPTTVSASNSDVPAVSATQTNSAASIKVEKLAMTSPPVSNITEPAAAKTPPTSDTTASSDSPQAKDDAQLMPPPPAPSTGSSPSTPVSSSDSNKENQGPTTPVSSSNKPESSQTSSSNSSEISLAPTAPVMKGSESMVADMSKAAGSTTPYRYKEDPSKPLDPEGKKVYDRDFRVTVTSLTEDRPVNKPATDTAKYQLGQQIAPGSGYQQVPRQFCMQQTAAAQPVPPGVYYGQLHPPQQINMASMAQGYGQTPSTQQLLSRLSLQLQQIQMQPNPCAAMGQVRMQPPPPPQQPVCVYYGQLHPPQQINMASMAQGYGQTPSTQQLLSRLSLQLQQIQMQPNPCAAMGQVRMQPPPPPQQPPAPQKRERRPLAIVNPPTRETVIIAQLSAPSVTSLTAERETAQASSSTCTTGATSVTAKHRVDDPFKAGGWRLLARTVTGLQYEHLIRSFRSFLNKITPQTFQVILKKILDMPVRSEKDLAGMMILVYEKAIAEPLYSTVYASLCQNLAKEFKVPSDADPAVEVAFRRLLVLHCQKEFEKRRKLGNVRFIGELFKLQMLVPKIMHDCVITLLLGTDEESLETLCGHLTTIGKELDTEKAKPRTDQYFAMMKKIANNQSHKKVSNRIRFLLLDVIELRDCNWKPLWENNKPKTIKEIHAEAALEDHEMQMRVYRGSQSRVHPYSRLNRGEPEGWKQVAIKPQLIYPSKMKLSKSTFGSTDVHMGPGAGFSAGAGWGKGSPSSGKNTPPQKQED